MKPSSAGKRNGFTLIEVIISISIASILTMAIQQVFTTALSSWRIAVDEVQISKNFEDLMNRMVEGDYQTSGLRDAIELREASLTSVQFVPLWTDIYEEELASGEFPLKKSVREGASLPTAKIKFPGMSDFQTFPVYFNTPAELVLAVPKKEKGAKKDKTETDRALSLEFKGNVHEIKTFTFGFKVPRGSVVRISYVPDVSRFPETIMKYEWDQKKKMLFRTYLGKTESFLPAYEKAKISGLELKYFNSMNHEIDVRPSVQKLARRPLTGVSAVGISVEFEGLEISRTMRSFVSIRALGRANAGVAIHEGSELYIPDSDSIRVLSLIHLSEIKKSDELEITIESIEERKSLRYWFSFTVEDKIPLLRGYEIEYPVGKVVEHTDQLESVENGIDLLNIGADHLYDYDNDEGVQDVVSFRGSQIKLTVTKMTFGSATLLLRP